MKKKVFFPFRIIASSFRYFRLKKLKKIRKQRHKNRPLEDYNYPLW